jgi:hypothetical protein
VAQNQSIIEINGKFPYLQEKCKQLIMNFEQLFLPLIAQYSSLSERYL